MPTRNQRLSGLRLSNSLLVLLGMIACPVAFSQTIIFDQANEVYEPPLTYNIEYFHPMGQEFTPTLSSLNFIDLMLVDFYGHGYVTGELAVTIHGGTINGPVLGTSESLFLQPTFQGTGRFDFSAPVPLIPGATYVLQVDVLSGGDWGVGASGSSPYPFGRMIQYGAAAEDYDLFFREGLIVVPEPGTLAFAALGVAILPLHARTRRKICARR